MVLNIINTINYEEIRSDAKKAAEEVLNACCPDRNLPIDSFQIADILGLRLKAIEADSNVAGGLLKGKDAPPIVFYNAGDAANRQRFTVAHEIGHYYRHFTEQHEFEYMDYRDQMSSTGNNPEEVFANQFAANLLMPEDLVTSHFAIFDEPNEPSISPKEKTIHLAKSFSVSLDAMSIRLKALGLVQ